MHYKRDDTPIRGLSTIFKEAPGPSLSSRFLEYAGNLRNLIGWFRRSVTKEHWHRCIMMYNISNKFIFQMF